MGRVRNKALALTWKRRIVKQRRSHLSVAEFCNEEGVSPKSFYAWRRRLQENDPGPRRGSLFVPVDMQRSLTATGGVRIELPGAAILTLPADASTELVSMAIRAAMRASSPEERPSC